MGDGWARLGRASGRTSAIVGAVLGALTATTSVALAHHGPDSMFPTANTAGACFDGSLSGNSTFCQTDNNAVTVHRQNSLSATGKANIGETLDGQFDPTDLNITYDSTPEYTGGAETDVIYQSGPIDGSFTGFTWCDDAVSSTKCDQHYVRFEAATPGNAIVCHESGHAVGLTHPSNASPPSGNGDDVYRCMQNPAPITVLGPHNVQQIDATY